MCLLVVFGLGSVLSGVWTDYLWFAELGYTTVFWTPALARLCVGLFFAAVFFVVFYGNLWAARRLSRRYRAAGHPAEMEFLDQRARRRWPGLLLLVGSGIAALIVGAVYNSRWEQVLLFVNRSDFGYADPVFGKDASFFVFTLPVWRMLVNFAGLLLLFTVVATALVYLADRALVLDRNGKIRPAPHVKAHLSVILALLMVAKAGDYMLQTWALAYSQRGVVLGASYTDVHALLPVLHFLAVVSLVAAAIFVANIRYKGWRLPALALLVMVLTWALAGKAYPAIVQQYKVTPNEISAESPYIANNIEATRFAFGLDKVEKVSFPARNTLTAADIKNNRATLKSVRLWEPRPALSTYAQIQEIRLYYSFTDVDVDRYLVDGEYRQVLLSARELDQSQLQPQSQTWVNQHFTYTHGYGLVLSPVNEAGGDGLPVLWVKDIPPRTDTDLRLTRPEIYFGELGNDYVVVKTTNPEFDYPKGDSNQTATYQGRGGIAIGSTLRRFAFSLKFRTPKLLFSDSLTAESRIMFRRTIRERVRALAPFLSYDSDPYLVIRADGSLCWMMDAYTTSRRFPFAQPHTSGVNYIRNPIKVVIDAYDGGVTFYQIDASDPLANAWGKVFPGLFKAGDQMPPDLRAHLRYPEDMFKVQADMFALYHMTDPVLFYNKEDVWEIPTEVYGREQIPVVPYYEMLALPGKAEPEFALLLPFAPLGKQNMSSLLIARQDGADYGKLVVLDFPKDSLVFGPAQVEARITNEPEISAQLTLWDQAGSQVIRGNLLVVPVGEGLMYFEPLYLQAQQSSIPELTRVIVAYADKVVMEPSLSEALSKLFGEEIDLDTSTTTEGQTAKPDDATVPPGSAATPSGPPGALPTDPAALSALAEKYYQAALAAQQSGNTTEYSRLIAELGRVLEALAAALQPAP